MVTQRRRVRLRRVLHLAASASAVTSASISGLALSCSWSSTSSLLPAAASARRCRLDVAAVSKAMVGSVVVEAELAAVVVFRKERGSGFLWL